MLLVEPLTQMIAITDLVKQYGKFTAVGGVTLDVRPGEIHGFLGPNGAGKTTTLRMIAGLLKPTSGRVTVNGHDLASQPEEAKSSLGFIPDRPFIYEKLTAGEFLRFHGGLYGLEGARVVERVHEYAALGVTHFIGMFGRVDDLRSTRLFAERVLPAFR